MNKIFKTLCLIFCFSLLCGVFCFDLNQTFSYTMAEETQMNIYEKIDYYLADVNKKAGFPAMSITIVDKNQTLLSKTYGDCKSTETPFLLGSVSKSFTALCIMQLV